MVMKTFRVLMALAVMVVIVGATAAAPAATMAGERTGAVGKAKPADKAAVKTVAPETKRAKKQEQAAKKTDTPADKSAPPKAKAARKKPEGDKPLEAGKNGGRESRKKSA
jgi:hypothetical protein